MVPLSNGVLQMHSQHFCNDIWFDWTENERCSLMDCNIEWERRRVQRIAVGFYPPLEPIQLKIELKWLSTLHALSRIQHRIHGTHTQAKKWRSKECLSHNLQGTVCARAEQSTAKMNSNLIFGSRSQLIVIIEESQRRLSAREPQSSMCTQIHSGTTMYSAHDVVYYDYWLV